MAAPRTSLRLFVGLYPPLEVAERLLDVATALAGEEDVRRPPAAQIHLTVQFIGDVLHRDVERTRESVRRAAAGLRAFDLAPLRLITLPERGPARLIAAETDAPAALLELHRRLVQRLARQPGRRPSNRFLPHLTLVRFRSPRAGFREARPLDGAPFVIGEARLMRSVLGPRGAAHHPVEVVALAAP